MVFVWSPDTSPEPMALLEVGRDAEARKAEDVVDLSGVKAVVLWSVVYADSWMNEAIRQLADLRETLQPKDLHIFFGALDKEQLGSASG